MNVSKEGVVGIAVEIFRHLLKEYAEGRILYKTLIEKVDLLLEGTSAMLEKIDEIEKD